LAAVYVTARIFPKADSAMHILKAPDEWKTRGANFSEVTKSLFSSVKFSNGRTRY